MVMMAELYRMPGHLLRRAQQISTAIFMIETAGFDLTSVQYAALTAVDQSPGLDATRLSSSVAFDRSTMGGVIDRLVAKGLLVRIADQVDRRVKLLYLTKEGKSLLNEIEGHVQRVQKRILEPLTEEQQSQFMGLLAMLVDAHNEDLPPSIRFEGAPKSSSESTGVIDLSKKPKAGKRSNAPQA